jgi:hypothetical protein
MSADLSNLSSLDLMRQLIGQLPHESPERAQFVQVTAALSQPEFFGNIPPAGDGHRIEGARDALTPLLVQLNRLLPQNPLIEELLRRYPA